MQKLKSHTKLMGYLEMALVTLFLIGIVTPGGSLLLLLGQRQIPGVPNRVVRAPFPRLGFESATLSAFPAGLKAYLRDNFGLRQSLIYWQAAFKYSCLSTSASPSVMLGKTKDWLFYSDHDSLMSLRNAKPFTAEQLLQWKNVLAVRQEILSKQGIKYLVVIPPDKHTVYPEHVPAAYFKVHAKSRREQLVEYLRANSDVTVMDLFDTLKNAKSAGLLYFKTDTHWNARGAYIAYQAIGQQLQHWFPQFQFYPASAYRFEERFFGEGDLLWVLGLQGGFQERAPMLIPSDIFKAQPSSPHSLEQLALIKRQYADSAIMLMQCPGAELAKAIVLRDSFANTLSFYLSEHFKQAVYLEGSYRSFPAEYLLQAQPQVVIQEFAERFLAGEAPTLP